jgi:predicted translin family RNA/ssDNA-binding protein
VLPEAHLIQVPGITNAWPGRKVPRAYTNLSIPCVSLRFLLSVGTFVLRVRGEAQALVPASLACSLAQPQLAFSAAIPSSARASGRQVSRGMPAKRAHSGTADAGGSDVKRVRMVHPIALAIPALPEPLANTTAKFPTDDFFKLASDYEDRQKRRDELSRPLQAVSRTCHNAVFILHRGGLQEAEGLIEAAGLELSRAKAVVPQGILLRPPAGAVPQASLTCCPILSEQAQGDGDEEEGKSGALSAATQSLIKAKAMSTFFKTGRLIRLAQLPGVTYQARILRPCLSSPESGGRALILRPGHMTVAKHWQEYLPGVIGFAQELQRYALRQGAQRDMTSLMLCKQVGPLTRPSHAHSALKWCPSAPCVQLVEALNAELMLFDFRNGPLRVKYDSVKYVIRRIEDTVFELSLQDGVELPAGATPVAGATATESTAGVPASTEAGADARVVDAKEFEQMRGEMEAYDALREDVIKKCRDMQVETHC